MKVTEVRKNSNRIRLRESVQQSVCDEIAKIVGKGYDIELSYSDGNKFARQINSIIDQYTQRIQIQITNRRRFQSRKLSNYKKRLNESVGQQVFDDIKKIIQDAYQVDLNMSRNKAPYVQAVCNLVDEMVEKIEGILYSYEYRNFRKNKNSIEVNEDVFKKFKKLING